MKQLLQELFRRTQHLQGMKRIARNVEERTYFVGAEKVSDLIRQFFSDNQEMKPNLYVEFLNGIIDEARHAKSLTEKNL